MNFNHPIPNPMAPTMPQASFFPNQCPQYVLQQQPQYIIIYQPQYATNPQINDLQQITNNQMNVYAMNQNHTLLNYSQPQYNLLQQQYFHSSLQNSQCQMNQYQENGQQNQYSHSSFPQIVSSELSTQQEQHNSVSTQFILENQFPLNLQQEKNSNTSILQQAPSSQKSHRNTICSLTHQQNSNNISSHLQDDENLADQIEEMEAEQRIQGQKTLNNEEKQKQQVLLSSHKIEQNNRVQKSIKKFKKASIEKQKLPSSKSQQQITKIEIEPYTTSCIDGHQKEVSELSQNHSTSSSSFSGLNQLDEYNTNYQLKSQEQQNNFSKVSISQKKHDQLKQQKQECKFRQLANEQEFQQSISTENKNPESINLPTNLNNEIAVNTQLSSHKSIEKQVIHQNSGSHEYQTLREQEHNNQPSVFQKSYDAQTRIIKKVIQGLPCSENKIIQKFKLQDALRIIKGSIFNQKKEMIFEQKSQQPFKLRQSISKNDEIVFAQIKESRRNNRSLNKGSENAKDHIEKESDRLSNDLEDRLSSESSSKFNNNTTTNNNNNNSPSNLNKQESNSNKKHKVTSKFHNLKKLFMYKLVATFNLSNMIDLGVPECVRETLLKLIVKFKLSAKKSEEFNRKTEFFSQAHYNALFLYLNPQTISCLAKNKFEVYLHKLIFSIDLEQIAEYIKNPKLYLNNNNKNCGSDQIEVENGEQSNCFRNNSECCYEEKIQYINILKRYCYHIAKNSNMFGVVAEKLDTNSTNDNNDQMSEQLNLISPDKQFNEQENMRMAYTYRALQGISTLSKGIFVKKF